MQSRKILISLFLLWPMLTLNFIAQDLHSQDIAIGQWRHHLPRNTVVSLAEAGNLVYAATPYGLLEYDKDYSSITTYDKVSGLSGFGIKTMRYSSNYELLLMGYEDGNIDVLANDSFFNISDIRRANIIGSKSINNIMLDENRAYLSTGFGIVILDLEEFVILDTWFIGPDGSQLNVYDLEKHNGNFYAATEAGLLKAAIDAPNLADFRFWNPAEGALAAPFNLVEAHNNTLFANLDATADTLYIETAEGWEIFNPYGEAGFYSTRTNMRSENGYLALASLGRIDIFDEESSPAGSFTIYAGRTPSALDLLVSIDGTVWAGDRNWGIIKGNLQGTFEFIRPDGPATNESFGLAHHGGNLWVAPGAITGGWGNTFNDRGMFLLQDGSWKLFSRYPYELLWEVRDFHQITPDPRNPNRVFVSAWQGGLVEFDTEEGPINLYNEENSTLELRTGVNDIVRVGGSAFDAAGNLWVSNSDAQNFLSVRKPDGTWLSYPHNGNVANSESLGKVVIDNFGQKWVAMPRGGGLIVFKEENTNSNISFNIRKLTGQEGNGALPSTRVTTLAKDQDGYIWVGTNAGVVVLYSPQVALQNQAINAQSIIVVQDGFAGRLFENETINSIFVDGSNKKWFGTTSSGAFLQSADGRETILHFTLENSPLPSNNILDISVEPNTGEVFFATDKGLVSFRGFATEGGATHTEVYAFPNPVRSGYQGYIAIKGLVTNALVKITDISGNLVYEGYADGGQFIWDGIGLRGDRPASGVYLVFSTNADGSETVVTKILFMN